MHFWDSECGRIRIKVESRGIRQDGRVHPMDAAHQLLVPGIKSREEFQLCHKPFFNIYEHTLSWDGWLDGYQMNMKFSLDI